MGSAFSNGALCLFRLALTMPSVAQLSAYSSLARLMPRSLPYACTAMDSGEAATIAYSSASAELSATTFCCLRYVLMVCSPKHTPAPLIDRADFRHPAQPLSVNVVRNSGISCRLNLPTNLGLPLNHLPNFLMLFMCDCLGADIARAASFTENAISGLSGAR